MGWKFATLFFLFVSLLIQDQAYNKSQSMLQMFDLHRRSQISLTHFTHSFEHLFLAYRCPLTCSGAFWVLAV